MNLNYDTSNLVVFQFPRYAGGKFVQNCLGLSDHMVFQKQSLAQAQIDGNFSFEDKKEYIIEYLDWEDCVCGWADLRLGCIELFMGDDARYQKNVGEIMDCVSLLKQHDGINDTVKYLSHQEDRPLLFSIVIHSPNHKRLYPNAKIIQWKNNNEFIRKRTKLLSAHHMPPAWSIWNDTNQSEADFVWDTSWNNNLTQTMDGIHSLYNFLNLNDWDKVKEFVEEYYYLWIEKIYTPKPPINERPEYN
jgi:hypothetical protein